MEQQVVPYVDEATWLQERLHDITSTEAGVLFNASPYMTPFELFHSKRSRIIEARSDNPRMTWGRRLQDPIALGVADDLCIEVRKMTEYIRLPTQRLGASFDFQIVGARGTGDKSPVACNLLTKGAGLMEIKTVDPFVFKDAWVIYDGDAVEAPPHIELQVQHQLLVSGLQWALIVALIGGNRISIIERSYDPEIGAAIIAKANEFWQMVDMGTAPPADYTRDARVIDRLYRNAIDGKVLDARDDDILGTWVSEYQTLGRQLHEHGRDRDAVRARILERIGDAASVRLIDGRSMSAGTVSESLIPQHVRTAYRTIRVFNRKGA